MVRSGKGSVWIALGLIIGLGGCGGGGTGSSAQPSTVPSADVPTAESGGTTTEDSGRVSLAWTSSPVNTDGSCSPGIQGYLINLGLSPDLYSRTDFVVSDDLNCSDLEVTACGNLRRCTYTVEGLTSASWYISLQTVDVHGNVSAFSEAVVATVYVE